MTSYKVIIRRNHSFRRLEEEDEEAEWKEGEEGYEEEVVDSD